MKRAIKRKAITQAPQSNIVYFPHRYKHTEYPDSLLPDEMRNAEDGDIVAHKIVGNGFVELGMNHGDRVLVNRAFDINRLRNHSLVCVRYDDNVEAYRFGDLDRDAHKHVTGHIMGIYRPCA
ncbi:MAG: hypothetical protein KF855_03510 [Acidobacteria bacterium]|nr:hypothetical protein [Acidobacteriota bacterium]